MFWSIQLKHTRLGSDRGSSEGPDHPSPISTSFQLPSPCFLPGEAACIPVVGRFFVLLWKMPVPATSLRCGTEARENASRNWGSHSERVRLKAVRLLPGGSSAPRLAFSS